MSNTLDNLPIHKAIEASEQQDRIVKMHYTEFRHSQLYLASDDSVTDDGLQEWEYWTDTWRIHLVRN